MSDRPWSAGRPAEVRSSLSHVQSVWAVTAFDDAVELTYGLDDEELRALLSYERENSDRPRYRRMLLKRVEGMGAPESA
jgi:hypothetical protein